MKKMLIGSIVRDNGANRAPDVYAAPAPLWYAWSPILVVLRDSMVGGCADALTC